jgi:hypothetical protein
LKCFHCQTTNRADFTPGILRLETTPASNGKTRSNALCRSCRQQYFRHYRAANKEKIAVASREYYQRPEVKERLAVNKRARYEQGYREVELLRYHIRMFLAKPRKFSGSPADNNIPALAYAGPRPKVREWWERGGDFDGGAWGWTPARAGSQEEAA